MRNQDKNEKKTGWKEKNKFGGHQMFSGWISQDNEWEIECQ